MLKGGASDKMTPPLKKIALSLAVFHPQQQTGTYPRVLNGFAVKMIQYIQIRICTLHFHPRSPNSRVASPLQTWRCGRRSSLQTRPARINEFIVSQQSNFCAIFKNNNINLWRETVEKLREEDIFWYPYVSK